MRVSYIGITSVFQTEEGSSILPTRSKHATKGNELTTRPIDQVFGE